MRMLRSIQYTLAASALAAGVLCSSIASAFQLMPMSIEFSPTGEQATQTFAILNNGASAVAVQVFAAKRAVALDGTETLTPAENEFLVFPPQAVIPADRIHLVQVRWLGSRTPTNELSYRLIAEQLPVNLDTTPVECGRIDILMRYEGSMYVTPAGAKPNVSVESIAAVQTPDGPKLAVTLNNRGTAHGVLRDPVLTVTGRGPDGRQATADLRKEALGAVVGANILSGSSRQFLLAWPKALAEVDVSAKLTTKYED